MQWRTQFLIRRAQLLKRSRHKLFRLASNSRSANSQAILCIDTLFALLFDFQHLLRALTDRHVPRGLVDQSASGHVLQALLLDFDVD